MTTWKIKHANRVPRIRKCWSTGYVGLDKTLGPFRDGFISFGLQKLPDDFNFNWDTLIELAKKELNTIPRDITIIKAQVYYSEEALDGSFTRKYLWLTREY